MLRKVEPFRERSSDELPREFDLAEAALLAVFVGPAQGAAIVPSGFTQSSVVEGLTDAADLEFAPNGRLFVDQNTGKLLVGKPDGTLVTFLDISAKVDSAGECGLLGLTFDPAFADSHYVYLSYTKKATAATPAHNRVVCGSRPAAIRLSPAARSLSSG